MANSPPSSPEGRPIYQQGMLRSRESPPCSPRAHPIHPYSAESSIGATPLAIRGAPTDFAPPPLPPPTNVPTGRAAPRETWDARHAFKGSGSVRPGSSLFGGGSWDPSRHQLKRPQHRQTLSISESILPPSPLRDEMAFPRNIKQEEGGLPPISSFTGGRPLDTQNHQKTTEAYDRHLLNKIGRPKTPVRSSTLASVDTSPVNAGRPLRVDTQPFNRLTLADRTVNAHPESPFKSHSPWGTRWPPMPHSGAISPSIISSTASTRSFGMAELRSPQSSYEPSTAPSSLSAEHASFSRIGSLDRGNSDSLSLLSSAFENDPDRTDKHRYALGPAAGTRGPQEWGRSNRGGSFDHHDPIFPGEEHESEFTANIPNSLRSQFQDARGHRRSLPFEGCLPDAGGSQGVKRKASPSLGDSVADEPLPQATRSRTPGRTTKRTSPTQQAHSSQLSYGSHSASSLHNSSYASSNLSLAQSSVTSYGTPDHTSPSVSGSLSEGTDSRHPSQFSYGASGGLDSTAQSSAAPVPSGQRQGSTSSAVQQEVVSGKSGREGGIVATHIHVCDCCPKKPKKFNTLGELQTHQREKQFYCTYCHNRFKNKNEAERHQNSLHLRKQSWSCAALGNKIDRAFHPCTATPSANPSQMRSPTLPPADYDVCGYCGKQYSNYPSPDWAERQKHLSEVHKFGECNQSKKFFRADHFRQHLKHSHQGLSGKWTNMLEQACLREEPLLGVVDVSAQDSMRQQQQQASQTIHAAQAASHQAPITSYQVEALQAATAAASSPLSNVSMRAGPSYTSAIGSHVQYEPKIDEEDEARD